MALAQAFSSSEGLPFTTGWGVTKWQQTVKRSQVESS